MLRQCAWAAWDTPVASFDVHRNKPWHAYSLLPLAACLGREFLLCGNLNRHHTPLREASLLYSGPSRCKHHPASTVNWGVFRSLSGTPADNDSLQHFIDSAQAATVMSRIQCGGPAPDLKQLQLWAMRRKAECRVIRRIGQPSVSWTLFVDDTQTDDKVAALLGEQFKPHQLTASPKCSKRRSITEADGITIQMLPNVADREKAKLLDYLNDI
ncbi:hypothetical protein MTO96_051433 [Rhipicephalus appendiculatus]